MHHQIHPHLSVTAAALLVAAGAVALTPTQAFADPTGCTRVDKVAGAPNLGQTITCTQGIPSGATLMSTM